MRPVCCRSHAAGCSGRAGALYRNKGAIMAEAGRHTVFLIVTSALVMLAMFVYPGVMMAGAMSSGAPNMGAFRQNVAYMFATWSIFYPVPMLGGLIVAWIGWFMRRAGLALAAGLVPYAVLVIFLILFALMFLV